MIINNNLIDFFDLSWLLYRHTFNNAIKKTKKTATKM